MNTMYVLFGSSAPIKPACMIESRNVCFRESRILGLPKYAPQLTRFFSGRHVLYYLL
jgi:hypothetical protein